MVNVSTLLQSKCRRGWNTRSMRTTFGQQISNAAFSGSGRISVFGFGGGGTVPLSGASWGRNVNGTPNTFTYSGSNSPVSGDTS